MARPPQVDPDLTDWHAESFDSANHPTTHDETMKPDDTSDALQENHPPAKPGSVIAFGFLLIVLVIVLLAVISLYRTTQFNQQLQLVVEGYYYRASLVRTMRVSARERIAQLYAALLSKDPFEREERINALYAHGSDFLQARESLLREDLLPTEIDFIERHRTLASEFAPYQTRVVELMDQNRLSEARTYMYQTAAPHQAEALAILDDYFDHLDTLTQETVVQVRETARQTISLLTVLAFGGVLVSLIIAYLVRRHLEILFSAVSRARDELAAKVMLRTEELRTANRKLDKQAHYDELTELPNRRLFYDTVGSYLSRAKRKQQYVCILFVDLDGFKSVNDRLGHDCGDALLQQVAARLRACVRHEDMVARLGGDEFVIVLADLEVPGAAHVIASKVLEAVREPTPLRGEQIRVGCSIGCAVYPAHAEDVDALVAFADQAMYEVKNAGKNNYRFPPI